MSKLLPVFGGDALMSASPIILFAGCMSIVTVWSKDTRSRDIKRLVYFEQFGDIRMAIHAKALSSVGTETGSWH